MKFFGIKNKEGQLARVEIDFGVWDDPCVQFELDFDDEENPFFLTKDRDVAERVLAGGEGGQTEPYNWANREGQKIVEVEVNILGT